MRRSYPAAVGDTTPRSRQIFVVKKQKVQSGSHARQQWPQLTSGVGWTGRWGFRVQEPGGGVKLWLLDICFPTVDLSQRVRT